MNFQCIGLYKIPKTKSFLILKLKEGLILFDAVTEQMFQLNVKKSNNSIAGNILKVIPALEQLQVPRMAEKNLASQFTNMPTKIISNQPKIQQEQKQDAKPETDDASEAYTEEFDDSSKANGK